MNKETIGSTGTVPGHRVLVAGEQWHHSGFTLEMLHGGYRPLLLGEREGDEDEWRSPLSQKWKRTPDPGAIVGTTFLLRTTRPLPAIETPAAPKPQQSSYSDGGPVFPCPVEFDPNNRLVSHGSFGMTLRDWFAGQALAGELAANGLGDEGAVKLRSPENASLMAARAYHMADAMLKAREVKP
jgi:hypothetical protein